MDAAFTRPLVLARLGQFIMEVKVSSWPKLSACMPAFVPACLSYPSLTPNTPRILSPIPLYLSTCSLPLNSQ